MPTDSQLSPRSVKPFLLNAVRQWLTGQMMGKKPLRSLRGTTALYQIPEIRAKLWEEGDYLLPCTALTADRHAQINIVSETRCYFCYQVSNQGIHCNSHDIRFWTIDVPSLQNGIWVFLEKESTLKSYFWASQKTPKGMIVLYAVLFNKPMEKHHWMGS